MDGAFIFFVVVIFCIALGFFMSSAIYFRQEAKVLKQVLETQGNMLKDISNASLEATTKDGETVDLDGLSSLVEMISKQG